MKKDMLGEKMQMEAELQKAITRNNTVLRLYEKVYGDSAEGKVNDEWFMPLSHKYEVERIELKTQIAARWKKLTNTGMQEQGRDTFLAAIRQFMEIGTPTAPLLRELIDQIDVYETGGTGKNHSQRILIHLRFVGYIELPENVFMRSDKADTRQDVCVEYL